jgi:hypothetical protein
MSTPLVRPRNELEAMLNMKQTDLKLGEGTTAGPMVTFLSED